MSANVGRSVTLTWNAAAIPGVREKSVAINGEPVDVSGDDSDGWRVLLEDAGENKVDISISGVTKSQVLKNAWFTGERTATVVYTVPNGGEITGVFFLASFTETSPYKDAMTFEASLQSSGEVTYSQGSSPD